MEIIRSKIYQIVTPEFLFTGLEKGLEFLQKGNVEINAIDRFNDPTDFFTKGVTSARNFVHVDLDFVFYHVVNAPQRSAVQECDATNAHSCTLPGQ